MKKILMLLIIPMTLLCGREMKVLKNNFKEYKKETKQKRNLTKTSIVNKSDEKNIKRMI